jgi:hypothetical protein
MKIFFKTFSKIRAKLFLPGSELVGWEGGGRGEGGEMTQTLYAHMNKRKKKLLQ